MVDTILYVLCSVTFWGCFGYLQASRMTDEGHIFNFVTRIFKSGALSKITHACPTCIAGFWGLWFTVSDTFIKNQTLSYHDVKTAVSVSVLSAFVATILDKKIY